MIQRERRLTRAIRARLYPALGTPLDMLIKSISRRGLGGRVEGVGLTVGERVVVELPYLGRVRCTVRWMKKREVGVESDRDIDLRAFRFEPASQ